MASITLSGVSKSYDRLNDAVADLDGEIADGEFVSFLGPSGCGKTTTLRAIAGFESIDRGVIAIGDRAVSAPERGLFVPPERRGAGMVFQSYAVWPHMRVFDNVAYPLRVRGRFERGAVDRALSLAKLEGLSGRYPHELSGGQQQRVALARALAMEPAVLLLDEPLANLDAKLREEMRFEIKQVQERTGVTIVYVTHDQTEAMALSDRIVVMRGGRVEQVGSPADVYGSPRTPFVASFVGQTNLVPAALLGQRDGVATVALGGPAGPQLTAEVAAPGGGTDWVVSIRPEDVRLSPDGAISGVVRRRVYLGPTTDYLIAVPGGGGEVSLRSVAGASASYAVDEPVRLSAVRARAFQT